MLILVAMKLLGKPTAPYSYLNYNGEVGFLFVLSL